MRTNLPYEKPHAYMSRIPLLIVEAGLGGWPRRWRRREPGVRRICWSGLRNLPNWARGCNWLPTRCGFFNGWIFSMRSPGAPSVPRGW